jgi:hypothetical protein
MNRDTTGDNWQAVGNTCVQRVRQDGGARKEGKVDQCNFHQMDRGGWQEWLCAEKKLMNGWREER